MGRHPFVEAAATRGASTLWAAFLEYGIDDRFLRSVVEAKTPESSGWSLQVTPDHADAIRAHAEQTGAILLVVEIPPEIEERVVQAVAEADDRKSSGPA